MRKLSLIVTTALVACSGAKSSGTTSTSSGGTTSGVVDMTTCAPVDAGGGQAELTDCYFNADCACPNTCLADPIRAAIRNEGAANPAGKFCEIACATNADCDLPSTVCKGGACVEVPCGALDDAGTQDSFGYPCNALGTNDGTCFGSVVEASYPNGGGGVSFPLVANGLPAACWLGGTATSTCTVLGPPSVASARCTAGAACVPSLQWGFAATGSCLLTCDPSSSPPSGAPGCMTGETCQALPLLGSGVDPYGVCVTAGDGGCVGGLPTGQSELEGCYDSETCACPEACVPLADGGIGGLASGVCELPCATSADCPNPSTRCIAGLCAHLSCTGATCAFGDAGQGTCLAPSFSWFGSEPFCVAAGTQAAGETCDFRVAQAVVATSVSGLLGPERLPGVPQLAAGDVCAPGLLCVAELDGGSACAPSCTLDGGSCGDAGLFCYPLDATGEGFCGACGAKSSACSLDAQCCSASCAPSGACN